MAQRKYVSLSKLSTFLEKLEGKFAALSHKHKIEDLSDYIVDSALSSTSANPVQNKVLNDEFDAISDALGALELAIDNKAESWNDLADKPFYNEHTVIEWDGNIDNKDTFTITLSDNSVYNYYKLSNDVPDISDLTGGIVTFYGETLTLTSDFLIQGDGCYYLEELAFVVVQNTEASVAGITITPPSTGIYFMNMGDAYVSNLTYGSVKTLDEVFIPDTIARKSDIPEVQDLSKYATKATTLSGYGITDAYSKTQVDNALAGKADTSHTHDEFVRIESQTLTEEQQEQVRINIGFTKENALVLVTETGLVNPVANENGAVLTDENNNIVII